LITVDQNLPYQQNIALLFLSIIVLTGRTTDIDDLILFVPAILAALSELAPGQIVELGV